MRTRSAHQRGKNLQFSPARAEQRAKKTYDTCTYTPTHALSFSKKIIMIIEKESKVENVFGGNTARKTQAWKNSGKDKYSFRSKGIHHSLKPNLLIFSYCPYDDVRRWRPLCWNNTLSRKHRGRQSELLLKNPTSSLDVGKPSSVLITRPPRVNCQFYIYTP